MVNMTAYFDLKDVFVNELIGDIWLFVFVSTIIVLYITIKLKLPHTLQLLLVSLWAIICFSISYNQLIILWIAVIMWVGSLFYYLIAKAMKG